MKTNEKVVMTEENKNQDGKKEDEPYLAPVDEQIESGNMGVYLKGGVSDDDKKKQIFIVIIVIFAVLTLVWKMAVRDKDTYRRQYQERIQKVEEHDRMLQEKEDAARAYEKMKEISGKTNR
tara:strand:+ start:135 stop:497 length:363 start_codon:yes stop_codon:yes gene_type:complete